MYCEESVLADLLIFPFIFFFMQTAPATFASLGNDKNEYSFSWLKDGKS